MIGTAECVYETPCGWCSKWDKKCDKKAHGIALSEMAPCSTDKDHIWNVQQYTRSAILYRCDKCGAVRTEPMRVTTC